MQRAAITLLLIIYSTLLFCDSKKTVDELGLEFITKVNIKWKTVRCNEWPDKDGGYPCSGDFTVYPNGIRVNKNGKR
jgi:hypothetical protein